MSRLTPICRALLAAAAATAGAAFAQPVNDSCTGAETLTIGGTTTLSSLVDPNLATYNATTEGGTFSCSTSVGNTVWFTFTAPLSGSYTVQTCSAATGSNYDTILQVYSGADCSTLSQVTSGCNDDGCLPQSTSTIALTAGTQYWVQVAAYTTSTTPPLPSTARVQLAVTPPAPPPANDLCANAAVLSPSATIGQTVSSTPVLVGSALAASENALSCVTTSKNDVWYTFTAPTTGLYRLDTCGGPTNFDTAVALYTGACGGLTAVAGACNDNGGCTPASASSVTATLTAGTTYYAQVAAPSTATLTAVSTTALNITALQGAPGDTCNDARPLSLNTPIAASLASSGSFAPAFDDSRLGGLLDGGAGPTSCYVGFGNYTTAANNGGDGRDVVFSFTPPSTNLYSVRAVSASTTANSLLYITNSCTAATTPPNVYTAPTCVAASNRATASTAAQEELSCVPLTGSSPYFVWLDESALTAGGSYEVEVTACFPETEPNNTPSTANLLTVNGAPACPITGSIIDAGTTYTGADLDFFYLGNFGAGARVFALVEGAASSTAGTIATDFDLRVTTDAGTLEYDDANADSPFGGSSGTVGGTPLPAGVDTYLRTSYSSVTNPREPYRLYSVVQTGAATLEAEPNDTPATATAGATNYFTGDTVASTDLDFYAFEAKAGDLVFLGLDSWPTRANPDGGAATAPVNHTLQLWNASAALVSVDDIGTSVNVTASTGTGATSPTAPAESLVYRIRTTGTYYARVGRMTTTLASSRYLLSISIGCAPGGGIGAPTAASLTPATGTVSGGTQVTLTGSGFVSGTTVTLGGTAATITSRTPTSLVFSTPAGNEGAVDLVVTNPGNQSVTVPGAFVYFVPPEPPSITSVVPNRGPLFGGTVVAINGSLFKADAGVSFSVGGVELPATAITIVNSALINATTPAHQEGLAVVRVVNTDGFEAVLDAGFIFDGPPEVVSITPNVGPSDGGQLVTLEGRNFITGATVRIGGNLATSVTVLDGGFTLTARTPASAVNTEVDVIVRNTDTQSVTVDAGYTYFWPAPTLASISPVSGMVDGGTTVTLTGNGFQPSPTVTIGGVPATSVTRVSLTSVTAVTPPGATGPADVVITNSDSKSATLTNGFTYQGWPTIASVSPTTGFTSGGEVVTITGTNFRAPATVFFGANAGTSVAVADGGTSLTVLTPTSATNTVVNVTVRNNDTGQAATSTAAYTYEYRAPTVTAISPASGFTAGSTNVTITGTGFQAGATVTIGGVAASGVTRTSTTSITAVTPAGMAGLADVVVQNVDAKSATLTGGFRFVPPPLITAIAPANGPVQGGTLVQLTGQGFLPGASVVIGGVPAFAVSVTSPTTATAVTNANLPGRVDVVITNPDTQTHTLTGAYTYDPAPSITDLAPISGTTAGGTTVTINGAGFLQGATVLFGSLAAPTVTITSATQLTAVTPARAAGVVSVTVRNPDGQAAEAQRAYRFVDPPAVTAVSPQVGDSAGGTVVTITGSGFNANARVRFGTSEAAQTSFVSATELKAITPAQGPGVVDVTVDVDGAAATLAQAFTYSRSAPTLTAVAPVSGPITGGTLLTLTGTGFADGMTVKVGGTAATDVVVVTGVLARAVAPAHAEGAVDLVVTNDDTKSATLAGAYTYVTPPTGSTGTVPDGGDSGAVGADPELPKPTPGGVSCGCSSFDPASLSLAGLGVLMVLSRRRRRS